MKLGENDKQSCDDVYDVELCLVSRFAESY